MKQLKKHISILEYLRSLTKIQQKHFIKIANRELLEVFGSIALNILKRNIPLSKKEIKTLRRYENEIKMLCEKRHSLKKRRKVLSTGGVLNSLLSLLPTLIGGVLAGLS